MEKVFKNIVDYVLMRNTESDQAMRTWAQVEFGKDAIWAYEFYKIKGRFPTSKEI